MLRMYKSEKTEIYTPDFFNLIKEFNMKNTLFLTCALLSAGLAGAAEAPDTCDIPRDHKLQFMKTTPEVEEILNHTRPRESRIRNNTPKFVLADPNHLNFIMTVGGQLNVVVGGDIGNNLYAQPNAGISFITSAIPVPAETGKKGDFYINPINGYVDLQVVGLAGTPNEVSGYLKAGTNGVTTSLVLQRAYVSWRGITAGLKLTMFQDDYACQPPTIDPEGPSGEVSAAVYEIGYKSKSYKGFRFAAALDIPTYYSANGYYKGHDYTDFDDKLVSLTGYEQYIPDIPLWAEYSWSTWNRIRLSGIIRNFRYKDLVNNSTRAATGWGVMLSGNVQPASKWILYYQFAYGQGIGNYIQDIAGHPYSYIPDDAKPGHLMAAPMMGANFGVTFNATKKLQFNAVASTTRVWKVGDYAVPTSGSDANVPGYAQDYKYAVYGAVNCFYNFNSFLQGGIEYLYGRRGIWGSDGGVKGANDNRIQAQLSFTF